MAGQSSGMFGLSFTECLGQSGIWTSLHGDLCDGETEFR